MSGAFDAAVDVAERLLERGIVLVLQTRHTPHGRRLTIGVGLLDAADSVLIAAAASRLVRRKRDDDVARRRANHDHL